MDPFGNPVDEKGQSHAPGGRIIDPMSYVISRGEPRVDPIRDAGYARSLGDRLVEAYQRERNAKSIDGLPTGIEN